MIMVEWTAVARGSELREGGDAMPLRNAADADANDQRFVCAAAIFCKNTRWHNKEVQDERESGCHKVR